MARHLLSVALLAPAAALFLVACGDGDDDPVPVPDVVEAPTDRQQADLRFTDVTDELLDLEADKILGVSMVDYTGDGWPDITLAAFSGIKLFRNLGDGTFEADTKRAGLAADDRKSTIGVAYGDVEGDGDLDLYVSVFSDRDILYVNQGDGVFVDGTEAAGLIHDQISQGASFGDLDGDGDLDLFVGALPWKEGDYERDHTTAMENGSNVYWRNDGSGKFTDATEAAGLTGLDFTYTFGSIIFDVDGDGDQDLLAVHDFERDQLFLNDGSGNFVDVGEEWIGPEPTGRMGLDIGDLDGDGELDIYATNWHSDLVFSAGAIDAETTLGDIFSAMIGDGINNAAITTGWGCAVIDMDNDGDQDVVTISSYTDGFGVRRDPVDREGQIIVLDNGGIGQVAGALVYANDDAGPAVEELMNGYGLAVGDYDRDGDLDVLIGVDEDTLIEGQRVEDVRRKSMLLRNDGRLASTHKSVTLDLRQPGTKNPRAVGARVDVTTTDQQTSRVLLAGSSFLSSFSYQLHFGLGDAAVAEKIVVTWPDGMKQTFLGWPTGAHELTRSDDGTCCVFDEGCTEPAGECEYKAPDAEAPEVFCENLCKRLVDCPNLAEIGLPSDDEQGCRDECLAEPLSGEEQVCFNAAKDCTQMIACLGEE